MRDFRFHFCLCHCLCLRCSALEAYGRSSQRRSRVLRLSKKKKKTEKKEAKRSVSKNVAHVGRPPAHYLPLSPHPSSFSLTNIVQHLSSLRANKLHWQLPRSLSLSLPARASFRLSTPSFHSLWSTLKAQPHPLAHLTPPLLTCLSAHFHFSHTHTHTQRKRRKQKRKNIFHKNQKLFVFCFFFFCFLFSSSFVRFVCTLPVPQGQGSVWVSGSGSCGSLHGHAYRLYIAAFESVSACAEFFFTLNSKYPVGG